jgi:MFS family permease
MRSGTDREEQRMATHELRRGLILLRAPRFGFFWLAGFVSNIGSWAQQIAKPWMLLSLGASPLLIGLDAFALSAPLWLMTAIGGVVADRPDRRRLVATLQLVQMLCPILLLTLLAARMVQPWMIIVLSLVIGTTDALTVPTLSNAVFGLVGRDRLALGLALNAAQYNIARVAGPVLAGTLLGAVGLSACFLLSAGSFIPLLIATWWALPRDDSRTATTIAALGRRQERLIEVMRNPLLRGPLVTIGIAGLLCGPLLIFSPVLVKEVLHGNAGQFSAAVAAFGLGGICGATGLLIFNASAKPRCLCSRFAASYGLAVAAAALVLSAAALSAALVFAGAATTITNTLALTVLQTDAPEHLRGRAVGLFTLALRGGIAAGSVLTGLTIHFVGARSALLANGLLAIALQLTVGRGSMRQRLPLLGPRGLSNDAA